MIYVHVAENHRRDIPACILAAGQAETDPDRRVLGMLGARGKNVAKQRLRKRKGLPKQPFRWWR